MREVAKNLIARFVGQHVAAGRTRRRLTQTELAIKCGISRQALSKIERGVQMPAAETMYALARALGMEVWDLLPSYAQVEEK